MKVFYAKMLVMLFAVAAFIGTTGVSAFAAEPDWNNQVIQATGVGANPASATNSAQRRQMAKRAAIVDAQRQLAEIVQGVNLTAETTVQEAITTGDVVVTKVQACIKGAIVVSEREIPDGYEVTMQVPLFGVTNSLAQAIMPTAPVKETFPTPTVSTPSNGGYTGLIVDCSGLGLKPVMSPVIKNDINQPIYGYKNIDPDKVIAQGMASYTNSLNSGVERAGSNPLIVKAISLEGVYRGNPVLSASDANKVLAENNISHFLENTNVVFVR